MFSKTPARSTPSSFRTSSSSKAVIGGGLSRSSSPLSVGLPLTQHLSSSGKPSQSPQDDVAQSASFTSSSPFSLQSSPFGASREQPSIGSHYKTPTISNRNVASSHTDSSRKSNSASVFASKRKREGGQRNYVIDSSESYTVEIIGIYPDRVWEELSQSDVSSFNRIRISSKGMAVCCLHRHIYVWRHKSIASIQGDTSYAPQAACLPLPNHVNHVPANTIKLMEAMHPDGNTGVLQVMAVSTDGHVIFWAEVGPHIRPQPVQIRLLLAEGEIVKHVESVGSAGVVCSTSHSTLWLIRQSGSVLKARVLQRPSSMLGSIASKLLFFSSSDAPKKDSIALARGPVRDLHGDFYHLTTSALEKWSLVQTADMTERFIGNFQIHEDISKQLLTDVYFAEPLPASQDDICTALLDICIISDDALAVLAASVFFAAKQDLAVVYTIHQIIINPEDSKFALGDFIKLEYEHAYSADQSLQSLEAKVIRVPGPSLGKGIGIYVVLPATPMVVASVFLTQHPNDRQITQFAIKDVSYSKCAGFGAVAARPSVILFSAASRHGIVAATASCISSHKKPANKIDKETTPAADFKTEERPASERSEIVSMPDDSHLLRNPTVMTETDQGPLTVPHLVAELKSQFRRFCELDAASETFAAKPLSISIENLGLWEEATISLSEQVVNARPLAGQRWAEDSPAVFNANPQLVRFQLEDKKKRFSAFCNFIVEHPDGLWRSLSKARDVLIENAEKLEVAIALCKLHNQGIGGRLLARSQGEGYAISGKLLLRAMKRAAASRGHTEEMLKLSGLSVSDVFYCEVTRVDELLGFLSEEILQLRESIGAKLTVALSLSEAVMEANIVFHTMLSAALRFRREAEEAIFGEFAKDIAPWTSRQQTRAQLNEMLRETVNLLGYDHSTGIRRKISSGSASDSESELYSQLEAVGDILLCIYQDLCSNDGLRASDQLLKEFKEAKSLVIDPLVDAELNVSASNLSEKYLYFEALVELCEREDDLRTERLIESHRQASPGSVKLQRYMSMFHDQDFVSFVFHWYAGDIASPWDRRSGKSRRKLAKLFTVAQEYRQELFDFLLGHSELKKYVWIHALNCGEFAQACTSLRTEGVKEGRDAALRHTLLSLGKLAAKASATAGSAGDRLEVSTPVFDTELNFLRIQGCFESRRRENQGLGHISPMSPENLVGECLSELPRLPRVTEEVSDEVSQVDAIAFALDVLEGMRGLGYDDKGLHRLLLSVWEVAIGFDIELWTEVCQSYQRSDPSSLTEDLLRETLIFAVTQRLFSKTGPQSDKLKGCLPTDALIQEILERQISWSLQPHLISVAISYAQRLSLSAA